MARVIAVFLAVLSSAAEAQSLPPVQRIGPVLAISTEPLAAVSQVRSLPGGRVMVHDNTGRRVILLDTALKLLSIVADTTAATAKAYGPTMSGLIQYRGDSTLILDADNLSMLVIDAGGKIVRTMAVPQPDEARYLIGGPFGTPGVDPLGRLVYKSRVGGMGKVVGVQKLGQPPPPPDKPDSAMVVRFDLQTRKIDTLEKFVIPNYVQHSFQDANGWVTTTTVVNPLPWTDDWALLSDGTVAVVHGREYRVDFIDASSKVVRSSKVPFDWQRLSDEDKAAVIDSARTAYASAGVVRAAIDSANAKADSGRLGSAMTNTSRASTGVTPTAIGRAAFRTSVRAYVSPEELPDYRPVFMQAASRGDEDGNLWIRTSKFVNGGAIYDVISSQGVLVARVQVPRGRTIAGFGSGGVVYMGVLDGTIARVERVRWVPAKK